LTAADDPFVPVESYERAELSPLAHMRIEAHGGHLGYLSALPTPLGTYRWLDWAIREYLQALASATAQGARNS
jgi:predicted alpha/beta-fold hydrolase